MSIFIRDVIQYDQNFLKCFEICLKNALFYSFVQGSIYKISWKQEISWKSTSLIYLIFLVHDLFTINVFTNIYTDAALILQHTPTPTHKHSPTPTHPPSHKSTSFRSCTYVVFNCNRSMTQIKLTIVKAFQSSKLIRWFDIKIVLFFFKRMEIHTNKTKYFSNNFKNLINFTELKAQRKIIYKLKH